METSVKNIFQNIPEKLPDELFQTIFKNNALHIERIVSKGYRTDPDHWYDQDHSELVLVLKGAATLAFASSGNLYFSLSNSLRVYDIDTGIKEDIGCALLPGACIFT
jgi:cupin 2 domain-containing protein